MSTKTLRKRIALATVAALGAGVLTLVSVPAAQAYASANDNSAVGSAGPAATYSVLNIGTASNTTGVAVNEDSTSTGTGTTNSSVGLVNVSDVLGGTASGGGVAGTTATAVLINTGTLVVYTTTSSSATLSSGAHNSAIVVSGGTLSGNSATSGVNSSSTVAYSNFAVGVYAKVWGVKITPNSGVTSMTVSMYDLGTTTASATNYAASGTLVGSINVTVTSASTSGVVSTTTSGVWYSHGTSGTSLTADDTQATAETAPTGGKSAFGQKQYAQIRLRDAYGVAITSSTGLMTATATNGGLVSIGQNGSTPTQSSAYYTGTGNAFDKAYLTVGAPSSAPLTTAVTVSYNGTVIGTKTFSFIGKVAKVTLSSPTTGTVGSTGTATIAFADAAGNAIYPTVGGTYYPSTSLSTDGSSVNQYITSGAVRVAANGDTRWPTSTSSGKWDFVCAGTSVGAGSANVAVVWTNSDGTVVSSNKLAVSCAGTPYTYSAKLDKTSYAPGDVATLTVTFKDSKGNLAGDYTAAVSNIASAAGLPSINGGTYMTLLDGSDADNGTSADATFNGVIEYKITIGTPTVDPYAGNLVVDFPLVDSSVQGSVTVPYKIVTGQTSLNDVLKGIVSLIASINKQIAALAKLVTKTTKKK